jgi:hypothetical protein
MHYYLDSRIWRVRHDPQQWGSQSWLPPAFSRRLAAGEDSCRARTAA